MEKRLTTKELLESIKRCYHMDGDDRGCEGCPNAAMADGWFAGCRYKAARRNNRSAGTDGGGGMKVEAIQEAEEENGNG